MTGHALKNNQLENGLWWPVCECGTSGSAQEFLTMALLWHERHMDCASLAIVSSSIVWGEPAPDANSRETVAVKPCPK